MTRGVSGLGPLTVCDSARHGEAPVAEIAADIDALCGSDVRGSRSDKIAYIATRQALTNACLEYPSVRKAFRMGAVFGNTVGGVLGTERFLQGMLHRDVSRYGMLRYHECASVTDLCAGAFDCFGPTTTVSTACSGGAMAIAVAARLIESGEADIVIAGGCDSLCRLTVNGFGSLLLLDPDGCRPFDADRAGISLGEGAATLILESEESAVERGVPILARLTGWGYSCDAFHATAPAPEGVGAQMAMEMALRRAKLLPCSIDHVNAHGTGTAGNDLAEAEAIKRLFGQTIPPVLSTKGTFGHTLGASGAIDAVVCVKSIECGGPPMSAGFRTVDSEIGFAPVREHGEQVQTHVMNNAFGFGGNNVSLVFSAAPGSVRTSRNACGSDGTGGTALQEAGRNGAFPVVGVGMVAPIGDKMENVFAACSVDGAEISLREIAAPFPSDRVRVYACPDEFGAKEEIKAGRRRRLERIQLMTLVAAKRSCQATSLNDVESDRICVAIGTGLGATTATAAFVEPLVADENAVPSPQKFTNAVHNALASQVAMEISARGLNSTITHREISFESALWHGIQEIAVGNSDYAIVGAADELTPYLLGAGAHWGWWDDSTPSVHPLSANLSDRQKAIPGEGAVVFCLAQNNNADDVLAEVSSVCTGRFATDEQGAIDATREADWIESVLARQGVALNQLDLILSGANGEVSLDKMYVNVVAAVERRAEKSIRHGCYKHLCGEYHAASAFGMAMAVGLVSGNVLPIDLHSSAGDCRFVLLYTLSSKGTRAMTCISKPGVAT